MKDKKTFMDMIKTLGVKLSGGLRRYPVSIVMAAAASVIGVIFIHNENITEDTERLYLSLILALIIGFIFSTSVKTIIENGIMSLRLKWFLWIATGTFTVFYAVYLYSNLENMEMFEVVRFAALLLAGFVLFMAAVFRKKTDFQAVYSTMVGWRLAITIIYTLVIWGGISLILFAIDELLGVHIDEKAYMDTITLTAGFFAPVFFFGGIPKTEEELLQDRIYKFFKILVVYVVAPILTAYTVVFYIYALRILFNWDWPHGIVGNMVLWYAIIGTVALYFLRGMDTTGKWASIFGKWFPRIIILPIILLFISLIIRVSAYGFTANRYFLGAAGIWTLGCAVYMSIVNYKNRCTRVITISLVVIALLSVIGPWNAMNTGRISQINRLEKILEENNMLVDGVLKSNDGLPEKTMGEISDKVNYLYRQYANKGVDFLPADFEIRDMKDAFGFEYTYYYEGDVMKPGDENIVSIRNDLTENIIPVSGYDYIWDSDNWEVNTIETNAGELSIEFVRDEDTNDVIIHLNDKEIFNKNLDGYLTTIQSIWNDKKDNITTEELSFTETIPEMDLKFIFAGVEMYPDNKGFELGWVRFYVLVKMK